MLATEVGDLPLDVPRDRAGSFEPRLVPKGSRRAGGLDEVIISSYAGGMTVRDIGVRFHAARGHEHIFRSFIQLTSADALRSSNTSSSRAGPDPTMPVTKLVDRVAEAAWNAVRPARPP